MFVSPCLPVPFAALISMWTLSNENCEGCRDCRGWYGSVWTENYRSRNHERTRRCRLRSRRRPLRQRRMFLRTSGDRFARSCRRSGNCARTRSVSGEFCKGAFVVCASCSSLRPFGACRWWRGSLVCSIAFRPQLRRHLSVNRSFNQDLAQKHGMGWDETG